MAKGPTLVVWLSSHVDSSRAREVYVRGAYVEVTSASDFKRRLKEFATKHKLDQRQVYAGARDASGSDFARAIAKGIFTLDDYLAQEESQEVIIDFFDYVAKNETLDDLQKALLMASAMEGVVLPSSKDTKPTEAFYGEYTRTVKLDGQNFVVVGFKNASDYFDVTENRIDKRFVSGKYSTPRRR